MSIVDWLVLGASLAGIVIYGVVRGRGQRDVRSFLLADRGMRWSTVAFSVMATQASAITFLSTPGQAYVDGMRFIQFYFGLPLAMIILSITAIPLYHRLNVYTAYEFLESVFDVKTRTLAAGLFLVQRGLAAGLTIYAPSIILSTLLGWNIQITNAVVGGLVIVYTAVGGSRSVSQTHVQQMLIMMFGIVAAFIAMVALLPADVSFGESVALAGESGRLRAVDFTFDLDNRYTFWSGLLGGVFLQLSYFGTDQSQVQRYLTGRSVTQSRMGLLFNGLAKIPMQFFILFVGAMLYVFFLFTPSPLFFNSVEADRMRSGPEAAAWTALEREHDALHAQRAEAARALTDAERRGDAASAENARTRMQESGAALDGVRARAQSLVAASGEGANGNDTNYIFLNFVLGFLPVGLVGLVLAAIFSASMSSTASEINALASTTVVDVYSRLLRPHADDRRALRVSRLTTVAWGLFAILFAEFASSLGSLIEAVNILGSLFYGTILGIFLLAFYLKRVGGDAAFQAAIAAEIAVILCFLFTDISFLWYNLIGCALTVGIAVVIAAVRPPRPRTTG